MEGNDDESQAMAVTATAAQVSESLEWLERQGSTRVREEMLTRYGITAPKSFGVPMGAIQQLAKRLGRDHDLAAALWATGWYEARMLAALVDEPEKVTAAQMDRWARDFDLGSGRHRRFGFDSRRTLGAGGAVEPAAKSSQRAARTARQPRRQSAPETIPSCARSG
jgi:hypothetical protein